MVDESDIVESKVVEQWIFVQYPIALQKLKQFTFEMSSWKKWGQLPQIFIHQKQLPWRSFAKFSKPLNALYNYHTCFPWEIVANMLFIFHPLHNNFECFPLESDANFFGSSSILWIFHMFSWRKYGEVSSYLILIVQFSQKISLEVWPNSPYFHSLCNLSKN